MSFNELIEMNRNDKKKNKDKYKVTSNYNN